MKSSLKLVILFKLFEGVVIFELIVVFELFEGGTGLRFSGLEFF